MRRLIITIDRTIDRCLLLLFIFIFCIGLYFCYDMWYVFEHASDDSLLHYKPTAENPQNLKQMSRDAIGWITIDDTGIDYPVMQGEDNMEYLNKDPYGEFSLSGSIFLDSRNDPDFEDDYSLIYGHHMEYGVMFGALDKYMEKEYFEKHRDGVIITDDYVKRNFRIFASIKTDASVELIFNPTEGRNKKLLAYIKKHAVVYEPPQEGRIIALSTCADPATTDRWAVFGILED